MQINITHLYPDEMNLYGDLGNVICLEKRCEWRGIQVKVQDVGIGANLGDYETDIYFLGGGQDADQLRVYPDLLRLKGDKLRKDLSSDVAMLAICGGYQLLGNYFLDSQGNRLEGISYFDIETVAPSSDMQQRAVGNLITELNPELKIHKHYSGLQTLVGFENHSGRTKISSNKLQGKQKILGRVLQGIGDNTDKVSDGLVLNHTVGSYMHGSILPKNPHLADWLITHALSRKYGREVLLDNLVEQDRIAVAAHNEILKRYKLNGKYGKSL